MSATIELFVADKDPRYKNIVDPISGKSDTIREFILQKPRFRNRRFHKYMRTIDELFKDFIEYDENVPEVGTYKVLPLRLVLYRQGWYFKKELLRSNAITIYHAFDKEGSVKLLKRFVNRNDELGLEAYESFERLLNKFSNEDHFIFRIAF